MDSYVGMMPRMATVGLRVALAGLCVGTLSRQAAATDWTVDGRLNSSVQYDDNIFLSSTNKQSGTRYRIEPQATLTGANERNKVILSGNGRIERFSSVPNRAHDDYSFSFDDQYRATERLTLGANASYDRQSLLRAELQDTGLIAQTGHRRLINGGASMNYELTETDAISLSGSYRDSAYSNALLTDYASYQVNAGWRRRLSDRMSLVTTVTGAIENPDSLIIPNSRYVSGMVGLDYATSETTSVGATVGSYYVDRGAAFGHNVGVSASAHATAKWEFTTLTLSATHGVAPSGIGQFVRNTAVTLNISQRLAEHLFLDGDAEIRFNKSQSAVSFALDHKYYNASAALRWEFANHFSLSAYYRHSRQRVAGGGLWGDANRFGGTLSIYLQPRE